MAEFIYNNTKNASFYHTSFKLNCIYYPQMSYKENVNFYSKYNSTNKLLLELKQLIIIYKKNLHYAQEF